MYYYTADLHFDYSNVLTGRPGQQGRPFATVEDMNRSIIERFNQVLSKDDILIILGDVACYKVNPAKYLKEIRGKKVLIVGNHDKEPLSHKSFRDCFVDIRESEIIKEGDEKIFLSHYPMAEWDGMYKGLWHFYGHIHNSIMGAGLLMQYYPRAINVGVDVHGFYPKTAKELMEEKTEYWKKLEIPENLRDIVLPEGIRVWKEKNHE